MKLTLQILIIIIVINNIENVKDEGIMEDSLEELNDNNLEYTKTFF